MKKELFPRENIMLNASFSTKEEAIIAAGTLLYKNGYVEKEYIDDMLARQKIASTYIGNSLAIPHGIENSQEKILHSGISFIQVPDGVSFGKEKAHLLIGIAGKNDEHLALLSQLATICSKQENIERLRTAVKEEEVLEIIGVTSI